MRKVLPLVVLVLAFPIAAQAEVQSMTVAAGELAAYVNGVEAMGHTVRFVLPASSRSWEECPVYGCNEIYPGGPVLCIDPPEPPAPIECQTFSEVTTYSVLFE
ncbi:MAG TPA: hypothetical protein VLT87_10945 [Thermoanaerobaculia bacterium]|nr:hypothetical protein [Thermoanaerobaculia bacterium]